MTNNQNPLKIRDQDDWRPKVIAIGGALGAVLGVVSALLYIRSAEETGRTERPAPPDASDTVRMGISLMSIVRTITEWAKK
jgi:hypothetical protein